jgi:hypothetical protein
MLRYIVATIELLSPANKTPFLKPADDGWVRARISHWRRSHAES